MLIEVPYGREVLRAEVGGMRLLGRLTVGAGRSGAEGADLVREALERPIGQVERLRGRVKAGEEVVVLVSDQFRQTRADVVVREVVSELARGGVGEEGVHLLFATGTHRPPTPAEQSGVLGREVYARFRGRVHVHDAFDSKGLAHVGTTSRGTPVRINRLALEADRLIATGGVVFHYFAGYGGGRKSVVPGVAGAETIAHNHAMNLHGREDRLDPAVRIGALGGNPVAEDMLEAARFVEVDSIVNTVLDSAGRIAGVFAGHMEAAHGAAADFARGLFAAPIGEQADIVVASSGTAGNFVQAHKALYNAFQAMKPGGRIVLVAECAEGLGGEQFVKWLRLKTRGAIISGLRRQSEINGQTALSSLEKCGSVVFVTGMGEEETGLLGAERAESLEAAVAAARRGCGVDEPSCYVMPDASYTVPFVEG